MTVTRTDTRRTALDRRIRRIHGLTLDAVVDAVGPTATSTDTVIAGGALAFAQGDRPGDVTLLLYGPDRPSGRDALARHDLGSLHAKVWTGTSDDLHHLAVAASAALEHRAPVPPTIGGIAQEELFAVLHTAASGTRITGRPASPQATRRLRRLAQDLVIRTYAERLRDCVLVALLASRSASWSLATTRVRAAMEQALTIVATANGVPYTGPQRLRPWLDRCAPVLRSAYGRFTVAPRTPEESMVFVRTGLAVVRCLTGMLACVEEAAAQAAWDGAGMQLLRTGQGHVLVPPTAGGVWHRSGIDVATWTTPGGPIESVESTPLSRWAGPGTPTPLADCLRLHCAGHLRLTWQRGVSVTDLAVTEDVLGAALGRA